MLLAEKDFSAVTTAEIARHAGVTEALIYKYFKDKRDLLYQVLAEYLEEFLVRAEMDLKGIEGAFNKLRKIIWSHINVYATNRVFAKILLLEVRSYSDYYRSRPYEMVRQYSGIVRDVVREGIESGEIRDDISAAVVEQCLLGCMEHVCMTGVVFDRAFSPDELTENLCKFIFAGLETSRGQA
jgi:TetR/AcrR family transcriptional regulator, fatty acid metabolism regulator protein